MRSRPLTLAAAVVLAAGRHARAADAKPVVDRTGAVAVTPAAGWARDPAAEKLEPALVLSLNWTGADHGVLHPHLNVVTVTKAVDLDVMAAEFLKRAKSRVPDQADAGTVKGAEVDGEDARVVVVRDVLTGHPCRKKIVVVNHAGKLYTIMFFCDPEDWATLSKQADPLYASVKWR